MVKEQIKKIFSQIYPIASELAEPLFVSSWSMRASQIIFLIFSLLFLITFSQMFFAWHDDIVIARITKTSADNASDVLLASIKQIPQAHLFGSNISSQGFVPITSLQLRLIGVTKSTNDADSRVIISEAGSPGKVYSVGDSLPSGIRVYAINNDGVIFENSNHLEKLPLMRERLDFTSTPKSLWGDNHEN